MPWQSELINPSFLEWKQKIPCKVKSLFRENRKWIQRSRFFGGLIMVHFNLPSVRGFAMSTVPTLAHHWGNHIRSGSHILCGFNPTKRKSRSDFPQYCNGCEGRDKCAFTGSMAKNIHLEQSHLLKPSSTLILPDLISWCLVGCSAALKVLC